MKNDFLFAPLVLDQQGVQKFVLASSTQVLDSISYFYAHKHSTTVYIFQLKA